jgi:ActD protein
MSILRRRTRGAETGGRKPVYGVIAEFEGPDQLVEAAQRAYAEGYRQLDAYTPFPVHGLADAIGHKGRRLPLYVLLGGLLGGFGAFFMQAYANVIDYPFNIGGRPFFSWPAYIPITFEATILGAVLTAVFGMLALNGLPQPYHPVFNVPNFELASRSHFFLCIEAIDPKFDAEATAKFLSSLNPQSVAEVEY